MENEYSIGEFAKRTGVTVRTLHYYDERGILIPHRNENGRRIYHDSHFVTMQRIVTLKFLGFSLDQMKELLAENQWNVKESLQFQKKLMEEKLNQMQRVLQALDHAIHLADEQKTIDADIFISIIRGIQFEDQHKTWLKGIYSEEKVEEIFNIPLEKQQALEKRFMEILSELKSKSEEDPAAPDVQERIRELMDMLQEIVGEDLYSFFEKADGIEHEEDHLMEIMPFEPEELEWIREAIHIFLENDKGESE